MIAGASFAGASQTTLLIVTRRNAPTLIPGGPRSRAPSRRKNGALRISRITMPVKVTFSIHPPSTLSSAKPRQPSKRQLPMKTFLNPPFDSVPHLIRPVGCPPLALARLQVPSSMVPSAKAPVTVQ